MRCEPTKIEGAWRILATTFLDERGFFARALDHRELHQFGIDLNAFAAESTSRSHQGVMRGLHTRVGAGEAKVVSCSRGAIYDVIVDLRPQSPSYLSWQGFDLNEDDLGFLYIPAGCAHGFQSLAKGGSDVNYRINGLYDPSEERVVQALDPQLDISWPLHDTIRNDRDLNALPLSQQPEAAIWFNNMEIGPQFGAR